MKILVTGSEGYIGTHLVPALKARGHEVVGMDTGFYTDATLYELDGRTHAPYLRKDIRRLTVEDVAGFDGVAHLAELSNDPLGMHNEENTYAINHEGSVHLARLCKQAGVERFVYTSSCSAYGVQKAEPIKTERSELYPQTVYAKCKVLVERDVGELADDNFSPTFLRNATAYGPSPRMRFDIVLNNLAGHAWTSGTIKMRSDGSPWRPLVHVEDICRAIACTFEAPREAVHNEVLNVGSTDENYRIRDIAEIVADVFPGCELTVGASDGDNRSYRVAFDKIRETLPGFACAYTVEDGARQLRKVFEAVELTADQFRFRTFTRLRQLQHLIDTEQIDNALYWTDDVSHAVHEA